MDSPDPPNVNRQYRVDSHARLANTLQVERYYDGDRQVMLAALRIVLGLPKVLRRRP